MLFLNLNVNKHSQRNPQLFLMIGLLLPQKKLWPGHGAGVVPKKRHRNRGKARWERQRIVVLGNKAALISSKRYENRETWSFYMFFTKYGESRWKLLW